MSGDDDAGRFESFDLVLDRRLGIFDSRDEAEAVAARAPASHGVEVREVDDDEDEPVDG